MSAKADDDTIFHESKHMIQLLPHPLLKHLCILKVDDQRPRSEYASTFEPGGAAQPVPARASP